MVRPIIVFVGICLATPNMALVGYLTIATLLQHFMILAEERICREKYGSVFENYLRRVPRYLFL
jgi:protein-S-isoprenylcysteine O-methyltransferase Ste14